MKPTPKQLETALRIADYLADHKGCHATLCVLNDVLGLFGVEVVVAPDGHELSYCNTGDPHTPTVCYDHNEGTFGVMAWGPWLEECETAYDDAHFTTACGHCGHRTPCAEKWNDTRCEQCGRNVQDGRPMPALTATTE
jgi:hypothetical protein